MCANLVGIFSPVPRLLRIILCLLSGAIPSRAMSAANTGVPAEQVTISPGAIATLERRISVSTDDAEESASAVLTTNSSDIELVYDKSIQRVGLRFTNLTIPSGSLITRAYLQVEADEKHSEVTNLLIQGEAADNPGTFSQANKVSTRLRTLAGASWSPPVWTLIGEAGANQRTPELAGVIQEIISRPGWASGNALAIIITGTGHRTARAFEGRAAGAALLHVEFDTGVQPPNQAPVVDAGLDQSITTPADAGLNATVSDDGFPIPPSVIATTWSLVSGPGTVTFQDANAVDTRAGFSAPGTYVLQLTASDGELSASDVVQVTVLAGLSVDGIHWTITGPTSVAFDWRGTESAIHYGTTTAHDQTVTASTPSPVPFSSTGPYWEASLSGLQPNTVYHYAIGSGPDHTFRTPPPRGSSGFIVASEGDVGDAIAYSRMPAVQSLIAAAIPAFVLMVGDLTYGNPNGQAVVDGHFNDVMVWSQDAAYMPVWGNHEWDTPAADDLRNYKGRFELPNPQTSPNAPLAGCCGEDWSWFDYGNVRFIAYPEPYASATWADWYPRAGVLMDEAQADPAIRFIVTFGHRPAYSSGSHAGETLLMGYLDALGDSHSKYVLNVNGHSHNYERSHPQHGVVHLTVGTGGSLAQSGTCLWLTCTQPAWSAFRAMRLGPVVLTFTDTAIEGQFLCGPVGNGTNDVDCTYGSVVDYFAIGAPANRAPLVDAGPNQTITLPADAALNGTVSDDGMPNPPGVVTSGWSVASGPGGVTFLDANAVDTRASFATSGTYVLQLTSGDGELSASDSLQVTVQSAPPPGNATVERRIAVGTDDAEENPTGSLYLDSSDLELVYDKSIQSVGLRFTNMTIPVGATITSAYIQFEADEQQSEVTNLLVQGEAADNPATFSQSSRVSTRSRTVAGTAWTPPAWALIGESGANQRTPELSSVIQAIVNRSGWASGNALAMIITGTGHRTARAFEGRAAGAALLHVELSVGGVQASQHASASPDDTPRVEFALHGVGANPSQGALKVDFSLSDVEPATLNVMDVTGRRVESRDVGLLGPGRHQLELQRRLPAGVYLLRLAQGSRVRVMKTVVMN